MASSNRMPVWPALRFPPINLWVMPAWQEYRSKNAWLPAQQTGNGNSHA